jgi:YfiH family protein
MPVETIMDQLSATAGDGKTLADSGFFWRERGGVKALVCRPLEDAGFANAFSTRLGGVSPFPENDLNLAGYNEDLAENIEENRQRFLRLFEAEYILATAWQVHGDGIKMVGDLNSAAATEEKFDALVSSLPGILVGVKTADCVPVLIADPRTKAFAAVHSGWRGTVRSIVRKAIDRLVHDFDSRSEDLVAAIGPAACGRNYEVGPEVIAQFEAGFSTCGKYLKPTRDGHAFIDLIAVNRDQMLDAGIDSETIYTAPLCTMERPDLFFSYRVEKHTYGKTGRLMSVIGRS